MHVAPGAAAVLDRAQPGIGEQRVSLPIPWRSDRSLVFAARPLAGPRRSQDARPVASLCRCDGCPSASPVKPEATFSTAGVRGLSVDGVRRLRVGCGAVAVVVSMCLAGAFSVGAEPLDPSHCSHQVPGIPGHDRWSQARRVLAPEGAEVGRLCRYDTYDFVRGVLVSGIRLRRLIRDFDALRPSPPSPSGAFTSCPPVDRPIVAQLYYPHGHRVTV